ncbi:ureidoglycolate lyase-like [Mercenaria mercenaria]|uniref:ureidoglycolate lyase-like n=1 Tax=Mercenaria mercenaria TaxID=6596 RepID=UPI00234E941C|nr:ureidoglycolate lyase-like [Mercenaria mercenaria]
MSRCASYEDAHDPKYGEPFPVPIVMATADALKGYGTIVTDFENEDVEITPWPVKGWRTLCPGTGTLGGLINDELTYKWVGDQSMVTDDTEDGDFITGRLPKNIPPSDRTHVLVREANYHPDGGQVFFPKDKDPFVALLALPGDDIKMEDFVAFYFDGSFGVQIHADIWHQPIYPIKDESVFLGKQGAVHACVAVDTVDEFGKYLLMPLKPPT